jgi:hypothetical protein
MTVLVEAIILISFIFLMGLAFGVLVALIIGRKGDGPGPRGGGGGSPSR